MICRRSGCWLPFTLSKKNRNRLNCSNFQAITVLNAAYKILSQVIFCRLAPFATILVGSYQVGFIGGKSITNQFLFFGRSSRSAESTPPIHQLQGNLRHYRPISRLRRGHRQAVKEFCYLGTVVTSENDISSEIQKRIVLDHSSGGCKSSRHV